MKKFFKIVGISFLAAVVLFVSLFYGSAYYYRKINPEGGAIMIVKLNAKSIQGYSAVKTDTCKADIFDFMACNNFTHYKRDYKNRQDDISFLDVKIRGAESLMRMCKGWDAKGYRKYKNERDSLINERETLENINTRFIDSIKAEIRAMEDAPFDCIFIEHSFVWNNNGDDAFSLGVYSRTDKKLIATTIVENLFEKLDYNDFLTLLRE